MTWLPVAARAKRYSIWLTSGVPGARSAPTSDGSTQAAAVWVIELAKPTIVRWGDPGTPVTVSWVPMLSPGPLMSLRTIWFGCVGQWPDSSVRSSTGPPGDARPTRVSCCWKTPGGPWPGGGVNGTVAVMVVSGKGPAAAVTPGRCAVAASWAAEAWAVAVTSEPCWAANAWSNGAFESTSRPRASVEAAVEISRTRPITTVCTRRPDSPLRAARTAGLAVAGGQVNMAFIAAPP